MKEGSKEAKPIPTKKKKKATKQVAGKNQAQSVAAS
jgi:hypothetical protein